MNMRRSSRRRGRRRGAWALFVAGVAYVSVLAFCAARPRPRRARRLVLPPPEPRDPPRRGPPRAGRRARGRRRRARRAAPPRRTRSPLAAPRASRGRGGARARAAPGRASDRARRSVASPPSGPDAVADLVAAARGQRDRGADVSGRAARGARTSRVPGAAGGRAVCAAGGLRRARAAVRVLRRRAAAPAGLGRLTGSRAVDDVVDGRAHGRAEPRLPGPRRVRRRRRDGGGVLDRRGGEPGQRVSRGRRLRRGPLGNTRRRRRRAGAAARGARRRRHGDANRRGGLRGVRRRLRLGRDVGDAGGARQRGAGPLLAARRPVAPAARAVRARARRVHGGGARARDEPPHRLLDREAPPRVRLQRLRLLAAGLRAAAVVQQALRRRRPRRRRRAAARAAPRRAAARGGPSRSRARTGPCPTRPRRTARRSSAT